MNVNATSTTATYRCVGMGKVVATLDDRLLRIGAASASLSLLGDHPPCADVTPHCGLSLGILLSVMIMGSEL